MNTTTIDAPTNDTAEALHRLAAVASEQNGYVTRAQAHRRGVGDVILHRLTRRNVLTRDDSGVYRLPGAPNTGLGDLYAAWLRFDPTAEPLQRLAHPTAVTIGATAAWVWDCGDLQEYPYEFAVARRCRTHRPFPRLLLSVGLPHPSDITIHKGIATTTIERTIDDLARAGHDWDHIGRVIRDAVEGGLTTLAMLGKRLDPLKPAEFRSGRAFVEHLVTLVG